MATRVFLVAVLALLAELTVQQQDPLKDFCRRFGHQTSVIDRKLYIDGGFINYNPLSQNPLNYTNTGLLYADLDVNNQGMPQEYDNLTKPASAPDVNGGVLWPDTVNKLFYLYGGEYQSSPQSFSMWVYDAIYDKWNATNPDVTQANIQRASYGSGATAQDRAVGFWYGGWLSNASVPTWGASPVALANLLEYDMLQNTWTNSSGPDSVGRAEGAMVYIPASDGGMLVYFGGLQTPYSNGTAIAQPMDQILLYDIANSKWYTQTATGQVPEQRRRFCAGATWAPDYSSYNIYLYGGLPTSQGLGFDDIYILSIPSFTWIKWYPTSPGAGYPHHSLSCDVIDGAQMIVMGGTFTNSTACDVPSVYAMHNMDMGKQNADGAKWALFNPNLTSYKVPSEIISVVGGSATGGATLKAPSDGFSDRDLDNYFQRVYTPAARSPTRAIPTSTSTPGPTTSAASSSTPVGAIVGGVVGGVAVLLAIAGILYYCLRVRKRKDAPTGQQQQEAAEQKPPTQAPTGTNGLNIQPTRSELGTRDPRDPVELSSPEGEAAAAKLSRYSGATPSPYGSPSGSPPPPQGFPVYPSDHIAGQAAPAYGSVPAPQYPGWQPYVPMQQPYPTQPQYSPELHPQPYMGQPYYPPPVLTATQQQPGQTSPPSQPPSPVEVVRQRAMTNSQAEGHPTNANPDATAGGR